MIDLYTSETPNGWKVSILLEELGLPYQVHAIRLQEEDQKKPEYLAINPNGRIPTIVDREADDFAVFESGAILVYLAEKTGKFLPTDAKGRSTVLQWVMFQMGGIGPMQGQANVFFRYFPEKLPDVISRYHNETKRLYRVLEERLTGREYLCDDYSIADMAAWPWVRLHFWAGVEIDDLPNVQAWLTALLSARLSSAASPSPPPSRGTPTTSSSPARPCCSAEASTRHEPRAASWRAARRNAACPRPSRELASRETQRSVPPPSTPPRTPSTPSGFPTRPGTAGVTSSS